MTNPISAASARQAAGLYRSRFSVLRSRFAFKFGARFGVRGSGFGFEFGFARRELLSRASGRLGIAAGAAVLAWASVMVEAQTTTKKPAPQTSKPAPQTSKPAPQTSKPASPVPPTIEVPEMKCQAALGVGVATKREFCDILSGRTPLEGLIITLPPHRGDVTLVFDLHNRHTYSEELMKAKRGFARYTAVIGALAMDNTLIRRAAIETEFRTAKDLFDRIGGGAGPGGVRAVAPAGVEHVRLVIPEAENEISLLGEKVTVETFDGSATYSSPGRPIAVVSNVTIEYRPAPPPKPAPSVKPPPPKQPPAKK